MKKEEKQLLLQDLCARLPYNVKVDITYSGEHGSSDRLKVCSEGCLTLNSDVLGLCIEDEIYLKPYLRPLSSMTEKEKKYYDVFCLKPYMGIDEEIASNFINWLNANHFDYRGLIPMGLANEAPEGMYGVSSKQTPPPVNSLDL